MALQGTIDSFPLTDVLRLLAASSKSGRLVVNGDRGHGQVWLASGAVTGGETSHVLSGGDPTEVVFDLLRYATGSFIFEADAANPAPSASLPVDYVLTQSEAALAEWRELAAVVPSGNAWLVLNEVLPQSEVVIDQALWSHLVTVSSGLDVDGFGRTMGVGEVATLRLVRDLIGSGLIGVGERPEPVPAPALPGSAGTDDLVSEVPWDQWNAEVFEPSGAEEPVLEGPERELFGAFDPFAAGGAGDGAERDGAGPNAFEDRSFGDAAFSDTAFEAAAFVDTSIGDTPIEGAALDSAVFGSSIDDSAIDRPTDDAVAAAEPERAAFEMGSSESVTAGDAPSSAAVPPAAPVSHAAPISHTTAAPAATAFATGPAPDAAEMDDDVIRQMSMLSPKAAQAVATAMSGQGPVSHDALPDSDEERDRLLKFLGSV